MKKNQTAKEGQVLLLIVMLLATIMTIVMTVVFTSRTEIQITKLQQDADKSLAAAEAGLQLAVPRADLVPGDEKSFQDLGMNFEGIDEANSKVTLDVATASKFVSPTIARDAQYTLYLDSYSNGSFLGSPSPASLLIYYGNSTGTPCSDTALEFTIVSGNSGSYTAVRRAVGSLILGSGKLTYSSVPSDPLGQGFKCSVNITSIPSNSKLMFIRVLGHETAIGVNTAIAVQGRNITSEAKTTTGVVKKVQLFQSYPQLDASMFVTSFPIDYS